MTKILRGIVHGNSIEFGEDLGLAEGHAVELIVLPTRPAEPFKFGQDRPPIPKKLPGPPPQWRPNSGITAAGLLAQEWTEEDDRILEEIERDRKAAKWREIPE